MRFDKNCERLKLRLYFSDGVVVDGLIIDVADPDDGDGFVYDEIPPKSEAFWAEFKDLERYDILEG